MSTAVTKPPLIKLTGNLLHLRLDQIKLTGWNPRTFFDPDKLQELASTIQGDGGVIEPVIVRPHPTDQNMQEPKFQLIAGERRWRASFLAKQETIPALCRQLTDEQALELIVIENQQREDLNAMEEAHGYRQLRDRVKLTAAQIAAKVGMSERYIQTRLQLLVLDASVQSALADGRLDSTRALLLAKIPDKSQQRVALKAILNNDENDDQPMTSREAEAYIQEHFTRSLQKAPWQLADAALLPGAGACASCPKNVKVLTGKGADICTDLACWKKKADKHWDSLQALAQSPGSGVRLLPAKEAASALGQRADGSTYVLQNRYVEMTDTPWWGNKSYDTLLKDTDVPVFLTRTAMGEILRIAPTPDVEKALEKIRPRDNGSSMSASARKQRAAEAAQQRHDRAKLIVIQRTLAERIPKTPLNLETWRMMARLIVDGVGADEVRSYGAADGWEAREIGFDKDTPLDTAIKTATEIVELQVIIMRIWCASRRGVSDISERCQTIMKYFELDQKALDAEARKLLEKPRQPSANLAQRRLQLAQDLNAGKKIEVPKGANAVRVIYEEKGKRTNAIVEIKDLDTLKGVGLPQKVEFGTIILKSGKPDRKSFVELAACPPKPGEGRVTK